MSVGFGVGVGVPPQALNSKDTRISRVIEKRSLFRIVFLLTRVNRNLGKHYPISLLNTAGYLSTNDSSGSPPLPRRVPSRSPCHNNSKLIKPSALPTRIVMLFSVASACSHKAAPPRRCESGYEDTHITIIQMKRAFVNVSFSDLTLWRSYRKMQH